MEQQQPPHGKPRKRTASTAQDALRALRKKGRVQRAGAKVRRALLAVTSRFGTLGAATWARRPRSAWAAARRTPGAAVDGRLRRAWTLARKRVRALPDGLALRARRFSEALAPASRQLRRALALSAQGLARDARDAARRTRQAAWALRPPPPWRFPLTLALYLLIVFTLEVAFLQAFMPHEDPGGATSPIRQAALPGSPRPAPDAPLADLELAEEYRDLAEAYLPASHARSPLPGQYLPHLETAVDTPELFGGEDSLALLADADRHPLLCVPLPPPPQPGPENFDSVRRTVVMSEVRMPVDHEAFHPCDKQAFLVAATDPGRLRRLFAGVCLSAEPRAVARAQLPPSAIAPPLTRLDKIRIAASRRGDLGSLSAMFESGVRGVFAIGYDAKGGTSYGKYQISSRQGGIRNFIKYLDKRAASWAQRLRSAGAANTGGTRGAMPAEWRRIAAEHPRLFEKLQDDFVHSHYYSPTIQAVRERTGLDLDAHGNVIREVLWSTAVHHGPSGGANIFIAASKRARAHGGDFNRNLLQEVYRERELRLRRLPLSQRSAIKARLDQEMTLALARLKKDHPERARVAAGGGGLM